MRIVTLAITGMLAACVAFPAVAAKKPSQTASGAATCTGMKTECLSRNECNNGENGSHIIICGGKFCDFAWEQCMKSGWWQGSLRSRAVKRR
jgi:hypothetical protein